MVKRNSYEEVDDKGNAEGYRRGHDWLSGSIRALHISPAEVARVLGASPVHFLPFLPFLVLVILTPKCGIPKEDTRTTIVH